MGDTAKLLMIQIIFVFVVILIGIVFSITPIQESEKKHGTDNYQKVKGNCFTEP